MSHRRERYLIDIIIKKLKFSPVVAIQGARQTGKSFLVKNILSESFKELKYCTFDKSSDRDFAEANPDSFIAQYADAKPLVIDEAQKVARIFDSVKAAVDEIRVPGKFVLLGSTEFSKLHKIRESLTGRLSKARLFPLTLTESLSKDCTKSRSAFFSSLKTLASREELVRFLSRGGLPGIFAVREASERDSLLNDWLELTIERDIHLFPAVKFDSNLARKIILAVVNLNYPDLNSIAKFCSKDSRVVQRHLEALSTLFVFNKLNPHPSGTGKPIYFLCDVALATMLGASFEKQLYTWAVHEIFAKQSYLDQYKNNYYFYRNAKGSLIHLIEESQELSALKILPTERVTKKDLYLLQALKNKLPKIKLYALGASYQVWKDEKVIVLPWESLA